MQPRNAAFAVLRRLAFHDTAPVPRHIFAWNKPASRSIHLRATRTLRSIGTPQPLQSTSKTVIPKPKRIYDPKEAYEMTFTCKPCGTRSSHRISKQGYHQGSVLIACPSCKNRHVISDHLKIFADKATTVEDILRDKGEYVKKGTLAEGGDIELWDDGTTTERAKDDNERSSR